jgi:hypothetical protein
MGTNARLFWILGGFFVLMDIVYIVWSILYHAQGLATLPAGAEGSPVEWVGAVSIGLTAVLSFFIAFYLGRSQAAVGTLLPEDRLDAEIDDGDAEQGFFSPWSWWPLVLAAGAALMFLGLAAGVWIAFIGTGVALIALVGWIYEYYRGNFAR